jgi:O-antigen/teichoic acid export membrane protein
MRHFSRTVVRNSAFLMASQMLIKLLSFGFSVVVVRQLGAALFGQYAGVLAFGFLFAFLSDPGLEQYAVREMVRWRDTPDGLERANQLYGDVLTLRFLLSCFVIVLQVSVAWLVGRPLVMVGGIALSSLGLLLYSVQGPSDSVLFGFERLDISAAARVPQQLVFMLVGTVLLWLGIGYYGLIVANLLGIAVMSAICWHGVRTLQIRPRRPVTQHWRELLRASVPFGIIGFTLGLSYKFDSVILNLFRGDLETGYYNVAYNLVFSMFILSNTINTALYPSLTRQASNEPASLNGIYGRMLRYLLLASVPLAFCTYLLADQVILLLYGPGYQASTEVLQIIIWVVPLMFVSEFLGRVLLVSNYERGAARSLMLSTGFNLVCNLLLVPLFGLVAAAIMTVITEAMLVGQYIWLLRRTMRVLPWSYVLVRPLLATILTGGLLLLLRPFIPFLANVAAGIVAYMVLLLALGVVGREELHFIRSIRARSEVTILQ